MNENESSHEMSESILGTEIKLVIFDLWQTLVFTRYKPIDEIFATLNLNINFDDFVKDFLKSQLFTENADFEQSMRIYLQSYSNDETAIETCMNLWRNAGKDSFLGNDSIKVLDNIKKLGYKLCLLTNIDKYGYENFKFPEILSYFDYQFLSYKEGIAKPDQRCWKLVIEKFGVDFHQVLMVGDSVENDIEPASKLGIKTFHVLDNLTLNLLIINL